VARVPLRRLAGLRGWDAAVALSVAVLAVVGLSFGLGWIFSSRSESTAFSASAEVTRVVLRVGSGDVVVDGGTGLDVRVRRTDSSAFGRRPIERRTVRGGTLTVDSRCPRVVVGGCSAGYHVSAPGDISVDVTTGSGRVLYRGFHGSARIRTGSGDVNVDAFCGFGLSVASRSGEVSTIAACAPKALALASETGDVTAVVPPGRYRVRASSVTGRRRVSGLQPSARARFGIDARSTSGNVRVAGGL
jgi:hypothetical protein